MSGNWSGRRADGQTVCVQPIVSCGDVDMRLLEISFYSAKVSHGNVWSMFQRVHQEVG